MNTEKAREFYSAYYEGTLDPHLKEALERKLQSDRDLQADYERFKTSLSDLDTLRFEQIEVPFDLNEQILARVDRHLYEKKKTAAPFWTAWVRNAAIAGLAGVAIFGAVLSYSGRDGRALGSTVPTSTSGPAFSYKVVDGGVQMQYMPEDDRLVVVRAEDGSELKRIRVTEGGWINKLENNHDEAALFTVEIQGDPNKSVVAVPGKTRSRLNGGQGTLNEFAKALAGFYNVPVRIEGEEFDQTVTWSFTGTDALDAAQQTLGTTGHTIELRESGLLVISKH